MGDLKYFEMHIIDNPSYTANRKPKDKRYTDFQKRGPLGAVLHSIGCPQPDPLKVIESFNNAEAESSVHRVLDAEGNCYQLAPDNYRLWHVGGKANDTHLGIEMTEPDCIAYDKERGYALIIKNHEKAKEHVIATYWHAVSLFAELCITHGWDPLQDGVILSHDECYHRGLGSDHGDPEKLWNALGAGYTMDTFRAAVSKRTKELQMEEIVRNVLHDLTKEREDNDCSRWSEEARAWAISSGIVYGVGSAPDGEPNYAWEVPITREQMVAMLYRFAKKVGIV